MRETLIAHFPVRSNTALSSNKYRFLNSLLLPKTQSPSPLLKIEGKQTTGLEIMLWGAEFHFISNSLSTEIDGHAGLSEKDEEYS